MSSYSKCQFCGSVEYTFFYAPRICGMCGISYDAGQEEAKERIIKLLIEEGILKPRTKENENDQQIIALIKGEK